MPLIVSTTHALLFVRYPEKPVGVTGTERAVDEKYTLRITPVPTVIPDWCSDTNTFKSAVQCGWLTVYSQDEAVGVAKNLGLQPPTEKQIPATGGFAK